MDNGTAPNPPPGTPLSSIPELTPHLRARLESRWLGTVEQVLAAGAAPGATPALREFLELDEPAFAQLMASLKAALPEARVQELTSPPPRTLGLGLRLPDSAATNPNSPRS